MMLVGGFLGAFLNGRQVFFQVSSSSSASSAQKCLLIKLYNQYTFIILQKFYLYRFILTHHYYLHQHKKKMDYEYDYGHSHLQTKSRAKFVEKVYSLLSLQLTITALFVCLNVWSPRFAAIQQASSILFFLAFLCTLGPMIALAFSATLSKSFPNNMILLGVFTLGQSYLVSSITSMYTPESVLMSAVATAGATVGITFYAMTTKSDFTRTAHSFYAFASSAFWIVLFLSMFNVFFFRSSLLVSLMAFGIGLIYCVYILIDTQLILGGKNKELTLDNYVMGAMILYVDIIGLFLKILQLLGEKKKK